jgi:hypothetical protein
MLVEAERDPHAVRHHSLVTFRGRKNMAACIADLTATRPKIQISCFVRFGKLFTIIRVHMY